MKSGFRIFDTHTHLGAARHSSRSCTADELLRNMDRHEVDRSLAIPFPVVEDYRSQHDWIGKALREHPDRIAGAACLFPWIDRTAFRDEVRRCREQYGFTALKLQPQYHGLNVFSGSSDFFLRSGDRESHGRRLPHRVRTPVLFSRSANDAGPEVSLAENCGCAFRQRHLRPRVDTIGSVLSEHPARTVDPVWSENWICMKTRYFATAARRSR
jgi:hypothetical protein